MEQPKSRVYILPDEQNRILRCEGGYTMSNISDVSQWAFIDEGNGDRYNLCQSHYFPGGLYTEDGIPKYRLVTPDIVIERTAEEIEADRAAIPEPEPAQSPEDKIYEELAAAIQEGVNSV